MGISEVNCRNCKAVAMLQQLAQVMMARDLISLMWLEEM